MFCVGSIILCLTFTMIFSITILNVCLNCFFTFCFKKSVGSYQTYGNNIAASAAFMAFNWEHAGSSLAILPIDDCGRKSKNMPLLHGHTDTVTDMGFSPFHDGLLATGSQDCLVIISIFYKLHFSIAKLYFILIFVCYLPNFRSKFGIFQKKVWNNR